MLTLSVGDKAISYPVSIERVALTPDGATYLALSHERELPTKSGDLPEYVIVLDIYKLDRRGRIDRTFVDGGRKEFLTADRFSSYWTSVTRDGRPTFATGQAITRYLPDGRLDTGFGDNGKVTLPGRRSVVEDGLAYDSRDRLLMEEPVTGRKGNDVYVERRLTAAGQPDAEFGRRGVFNPTSPPGDGLTTRVIVLPDDRVLVQFDQSIVRVTAHGRADTTFGDNGVATFGSNFSDQIAGALPDGLPLALLNRRDDDGNNDLFAVAKLAAESTVRRGRSGLLYVNGTAKADTARVESAGRRRVNLLLNGIRYGPFSGITGVCADLRGRSDTFDGSYFTGRVPQTVCGGGGNDTITTGNGRDIVYCDDGEDTVHTKGESDTVNGTAAVLTADTRAGDDTITGGDYNDRITSGDGRDSIEAGMGDNTVIGQC